MYISSSSTRYTKVAASVGNWVREFETQEQVDHWIAETKARLEWAAQIGLLKLINSGDSRWGRQGHEHLGYEYDPRAKDTRLMYRRMGNYVGKWMTLRTTYAKRDAGPDEYPIDLTDHLHDERKRVRAMCPYKADQVGSNWLIPDSWEVGEDGYYYHLEPDMMRHIDDQHWSPIVATQATLW